MGCSVLLAGDFAPLARIAHKVSNGDYTFFDEVKDVVKRVDYSLVNLECPIVLSQAKPIKKLGPSLKCDTDKVMEAICYAGFQGVTLANNHFRDFGEAGVSATLEKCQEYNIDYVGGGKNIVEAEKTLFKHVNGNTIAIINVCEEEFSIATANYGGSNPLRPMANYYHIRKAREKADYLIVIVHGGHEHFQLPSPRMQENYRFFIDAGADAVVNHHQHCFSGYEVYHGRPIFYGLGNFCFDRENQRNKPWNMGYMVSLHFHNDISFDIIPYNQCSEESKIKMLDTNALDNELAVLNDIINSPERLKNEINQYYETCINSYSSILEPIMNKYYAAFKRRGWLPSFITQKRKLLATDYICCESHRDKLLYYLRKENI